MSETNMQNETQKTLLRVRDLVKEFPLSKKRKLTAVNHVSFDVYEGEKFGVVGESGCGKSTLGRVMLQLYEATGGSVMYFGKAIHELTPKYVVEELHRLKEYQQQAAACYEKGLHAEASAYLERGAVLVGDLIVYRQIDAIAALLLKAEEEVRQAAQANARYQELNRTYTWNELTLEHMETYPALIRALSEKDIRTPEEEAELAAMKRVEEANAHEDPQRMRRQNEMLRQQMDATAVERDKHRLLEEQYRKEIGKYYETKEVLPLTDRCMDEAYRMKLRALYSNGLDLCRLRPKEMRSIRYDLQMIFQDPAASLDPRETVGKAIEETLKLNTKLPPNARQERTMQLLERVGLKREHYNAYPHSLSGGQKQRVGIARAIAVNPSFIVLDEAVSALDVSVKAQILKLLNELSADEHLTYFFITHDLGVAKHFCDRIMVLYLGSVCELAPSKELFKNRLHPYTESLLDSVPRLNPDRSHVQEEVLEGEVPSPINPPSGCPFHTRCKKCMEICRTERPVYREVLPGHFVACHLYDESKEGATK